MKDRIDVFIKIVGNISYSPKNIPRLRTCNFTAALEPYLKANDGVILNTTINTLTRITIGELFETKGITSEGTPSSQPAAPNWQTVVKRVTGLISNELKDLHDIEWKEENGAYTTEIFKSLRLIQTVYYALETRNAPAANVKQSRKDIASILIDANIVPKIYGMLTDLHLHTLEITDSERNEMLSSDAQSILCNYANASDGFAEHVANIPGFLEFISAKLTSASEEYLQLDKKVMLSQYCKRFQCTRFVPEVCCLSS